MNNENDSNSGNGNTLGEAANRYVTFQIVSSIIGGVIFLIILFTFFLPMFHQVSQGPTMTPSGMGTTTYTIDGRPATPAEQRQLDQISNSPHPSR